MPFPRIGLGGVLTLDERQGVQAAARARDEFGRFLTTANRIPPTMGRVGAAIQQATQQFQRSFKTIGKGVDQLGAGLRNAALGTIPLTVAVGAGVNQAATFEKQMSAVSSITRANTEDMERLTAKAREMGIVSVFSATESGQAMEFMARAGADTNQIISGLQGVMNAAAADSIDLATSADIVSQVVKGMGKEFSEANHIADVLALTSASANTNMISLGESFKFGVSQARAMGISLEETSAIFGKLADAGLRGSLGGTAFTNMLIKLAKPSKKGADFLDKFGVAVTESDGSMRKISSIVRDFNQRLSAIPDAARRAEIATEVFGVRGQRAFFALAGAGKDAIDALETELIGSSLGVGAAAEMAEKRLDNFLGAMTLFGASVESVSIGMFTPLLKEFTPVVREMTSGLNSILFSLDAVQGAQKAQRQVMVQTTQALAAQSGQRLENTAATEKQTTAIQKHLQIIAQQTLDSLALEGVENERTKAAQKAIESILKGNKNISKAQARTLAAEMAAESTRGAISAREAIAVQARIRHQQRLQEVENEHGRAAMLVAKGVFGAIETLKGAWQGFVTLVKNAGEALRRNVGENRLQQIVKFATIFAITAAAISPVILALMAFGFAITGVATALAALKTIAFGVFGVIKAGAMLAAGVFLPVIAAVGVLGLAFAFVRRENESIGETFTRVWMSIKTTLTDIYDSAVRPFVDGFLRVFVPTLEIIHQAWTTVWASISETFTSTVGRIKGEFADLIQSWGFGTENMTINWATFGGTVAETTTATIATIIATFGTLVEVAITTMDVLWGILKAPFVAFDRFTTLVFDSILKFMEGDFLGGVDRIAVALFDVLSAPFRAIAEGVGKLANMIPGMEGMFATEIGGLGEHLFPELFPTQPEEQRKTLAVAEQGAQKVGEQQAAGVEAATGFDFSVGANLTAAVAEMSEATKGIMDLKAREKAAKATPPETKVNVALEDKRKLDITNKMCVDGEAMNVASSRHRQEVHERAGFKATAWQRRMALEHGAVAMT